MSWGEVEVFQGRLFVTRGRFTTGVAVPSRDRLGETILQLYKLSSWDKADSWRAFCEDAAGVPARRYQPEKSARVYLSEDGWHVAVDLFGPEETLPSPPADDLPQRLGATVCRLLDATAPNWPALRKAVIRTMATGELLVMPVERGFAVGPARVASPHEALPTALADSDREPGEAPNYAEALAEAGINRRLLDGCAAVHVEELSTGEVRLTGTGSAGNRPVAERTWLGRADDLTTVCAEAVQMIKGLPVEHLPPGTPAGTDFGMKRTWLAVRDSTVDQVAAAIGLTAARPADWDEGVAAADDDQVFVSPSISGWIFVVNAARGFDGSSVASLSARLGTEVQYFGNHRVVAYAEWALAVDGHLVRHVLCSEDSEIADETGAPTPVELALGFSPATPGARFADEDDVMLVAAAWSLDPNTLSVTVSSPGPGLLGPLP
ncbi:hypothetical protein Acsp01_56700 [Actinoplanes sp. NBRC 101535]|nr:hypothetical protein Acsp01_56700 [Actinoplanes sp. NBRC 101535]